jgi:hypothetical protein
MRSVEVGNDPETGEELEKILIELPSDHWSELGGGRVWAKPLGDDQYEIRNTPWYAYDINWGDIVVCEGMSPRICRFWISSPRSTPFPSSTTSRWPRSGAPCVGDRVVLSQSETWKRPE